MKYRHCSLVVLVTLLCTYSMLPQDPPPTASPRNYFSSLNNLSKTPTKLVKIGVLLSSDSPLQVLAKDVRRAEFCHFSLGFVSDPPTIAQRLFDGFLTLERMRVDLIVIEEVEGRKGSAIMNRVRKATRVAVADVVLFPNF